MENNAKIEFFKAFNKCQGALSPVKADSSNSHFGNRYPSLAAVMDAVRPFIEAGFSFIHEGVTINGKAFLRTSMVYNDYERVSDWPLVDDGNPQHLASASTYAKRYSISGLTGLVIDTDDDGNAAAGEKSSLRVPAKLSESVPQKTEIYTKTFFPGVVTTKPASNGGVRVSVMDQDKIWYSSLKEDDGITLGKAKAESKRVVVAYKKNGDYNNITKVYIEDASKPLDDANDAF